MQNGHKPLGSKEDFQRYRRIQNSGRINMLHVSIVCEAASLEREVYFDIIKHYDAYVDAYGED